MTQWVIGDLQGCHASLQRLLQHIGFSASRDQLIFVGDLVNRGPGSLACLQQVQSLCEQGAARCVLGNHDLHLLGVAAGVRRSSGEDTLQDILASPRRSAMLDWLARQPLMIQQGDDIIVHAGLHPQWDLETAAECTQEVAEELASRRRRDAFLARMYGNQPKRWQDCIDDAEGRQRFTVNACTRMRFVRDSDHALMLKAKGSTEQPPEGGMSWFAAPSRRPASTRVLFGHWSTLGAVFWPQYLVVGLDTGCIWGGKLTALDRNSGTLASVEAVASETRTPGLD